MTPLYVEITPLLVPALAGIGRFTARLVEALARGGPLRLFALQALDGASDGIVQARGWAGHVLPVAAGSLAPADAGVDAWVGDLLRRPRLRDDDDLARRSACVYPWIRPDARRFAREIQIVHDFTPLLLPWAHARRTRELFGWLLVRALRHSDALVAVSAATKADAAWLAPVAGDVVVVASPGPSLCNRVHASAAAVPRSRHVIGVVATHEPRKNADFVVEWFRHTRELEPGAELWWVGRRGWLAPRWRLRRRPPDRRLRFLGAVSDRHLCELYRRAAFTLCPSLYEGFGFPVLDSLRHGAPVACSFNSALKEFAGDGVFFFDPGDPASLDAACRDLLASRPPAVRRADLQARCSWDALANTVRSLCGHERVDHVGA